MFSQRLITPVFEVPRPLKSMFQVADRFGARHTVEAEIGPKGYWDGEDFVPVGNTTQVQYKVLGPPEQPLSHLCAEESKPCVRQNGQTIRYDAEITYVGTPDDIPGNRQRGLATALVKEYIERCRRLGIPGIFLEDQAVSASGKSGLYDRLGFKPHGDKKRLSLEA